MSNLIPSLNNFKYPLAKLLTSVRPHKIYDLLFVSEEPQQFYLGDGTKRPSTLLPFQTAVKNHRFAQVNATALLTAAQIKAGVIKSTSAAAVSMTLPTAALMVAELGARPTAWFEFAIDNSGGANTITLIGGTGVTAATEVVTGGATLTVAAGAVGLFRLYFVSGTVAKLYRVG